MVDVRFEGAPELSLVVARVGDLAAGRRFYEMLGLAFHPEQHGLGSEHLSTVIGGVVFELYPQGSGLSTEGLRLGLAVADLTAVTVRCGTAGVKDRERAGQRVVVVRDPDGHKIELTQASAV